MATRINSSNRKGSFNARNSQLVDKPVYLYPIQTLSGLNCMFNSK